MERCVEENSKGTLTGMGKGGERGERVDRARHGKKLLPSKAEFTSWEGGSN